jgi:hypothetical protein
MVLGMVRPGEPGESLITGDTEKSHKYLWVFAQIVLAKVVVIH